MSSISQINVEVGANIAKLVKGLRDSERALLRSGRKLKALGDDLTTSVSLPLAAIGGIGLKMSRDLQTSFSKIENLVGVTGSKLDEFKEGIKSISSDVGKSQTQLSDALFTITSAGLKGGEALELLSISSKASVIGMGETKDIAKAATAIMQAYGKENVSAAEAVNLLTKTVREGNLEASELAPAIGKVLPIAAQMGVTFEEVGANIATFTRLGISAGESVSAMKAFLGNLIKPGKKATETLAKYGLTAQGVRDSIAKNGLSATLQELLKKFDGNVESASNLFGSVEGLANVLGTAGAQGEEYTRILESMKDGTDIVEEGFQKASETADQKFNKALVRLQNSAINIGNVVLPIFTEVAEVVAEWAGKFANLDQSTQRTIIKIGAMVAAIGPVIKLWGVYKTTLAATKAVQEAFILTKARFIIKMKAAAASFAALNNVMKATVIGAVVAAIAAAVVVFRKWNNQTTKAQKIQKTLNDINIKAAQSIVEEKIEVERLVGVLKNENATRSDKKKALKELNRISPQYFGGLDTEKSKIEDVTKAMDSYIANLLQMAKVQAAKEKIIDLNKALLDTDQIMEDTKPGMDSYQAAWVRMTDFTGSRSEKLNKIWIDNIHNHKAGLQGQIDDLAKFVAAEDNLHNKRKTSTSPTSFNIPTSTVGGSTDPKTPKRSKVEIIDIQSINEQKAASDALFTSLVTGLQNSKIFQEQFKNEQAVSDQNLKNFLSTVATSPEHFEMMRAGLEQVKLEMQEIDEQEKRFEAMMEAAQVAGDAIESYAQQGGDSLRELGKVALKSAADFVRAQIMQAVSSFISKALATMGPLGLVVAAGASAVVGTLFNKAIGSIGVPALAEGGLASAPTLAMVGDNPNASVDPEVIAPLSKLKRIMGDAGGMMEIFGRTQIKGDDLYIIWENAQRKKQRTRGF